MRQNFAAKLPIEVKVELDKRLRKSCYCLPGEHAEWLTNLGHNTSRSAMSRYSKVLNIADCAAKSSTEITANMNKENAHLSRKDQILIELGKLKIRENMLIEQLTKLDDAEDFTAPGQDTHAAPSSN